MIKQCRHSSKCQKKPQRLASADQSTTAKLGAKTALCAFMFHLDLEKYQLRKSTKGIFNRHWHLSDFRVPLSDEAMKVIELASPFAQNGLLFPNVNKAHADRFSMYIGRYIEITIIWVFFDLINVECERMAQLLPLKVNQALSAIVSDAYHSLTEFTAAQFPFHHQSLITRELLSPR